MASDEKPPKTGKLRAVLPFAGVLLLGLGAGFGATLAYPAAEEAPGGESSAGSEETPATDGEPPAADATGANGEKPPAASAEGGHGGAADAATAGAAPHGEGAQGTEAIGATISESSNPGKFVINLKGGGGGRILRLELQIAAADADMKALEALKPLLRDEVIMAVSDYTWAELEGTEGKVRLKDELLLRMNGVTAPRVVLHLYLIDFVVS